MLLTCPRPTELNDIPTSQCRFKIEQLQRLYIQRVLDSNGDKNSIDHGTNDATLQSTWDVYFTATDSTKIVKTPLISNPESDGGDPITYGGDNSTINGQNIIVGQNLVSMTAALYNVEQTVVQKMKNLIGENIGVYMIDRYGRIFAKADAPDSPTTLYPIPIKSFFVGDLMPQGLSDPDMNNMQWQFEPNYSDLLTTITPSDFDALTV